MHILECFRCSNEKLFYETDAFDIKLDVLQNSVKEFILVNPLCTYSSTEDKLLLKHFQNPLEEHL